jgi:hypothetical protein
MVLQQQPHATRRAASSQIEAVGADDEVDCVGRGQRTRQRDSARAEAITALGGAVGRHPLPVHFEGWTHFTQDADNPRAAFAGNGVADRLHVAERGATGTM